LSLRIFPESQPSSAFSKFFVTKCGSDSYFKSKCRGRWGSLIRSYRPPPRTNLRTTSRMRQLIKLLRSHQSRLTLNPTSSQFSYHTRPRNMSFETTGTIASFGGKLLKLKHKSSSTNTDMELNLFMPPQAQKSGAKVPVLFYLSGLTCTGNNCSEKGFFQHGAAKHGIAVVYPDTSPSTSFALCLQGNRLTR
jgi:hypothetical protein